MKPFVRFSQLSRHVAEKGSVENRDSKQPRHCTGSQREETAEEVILQRLLRQMKLTVFALQAFLQRRQFITIKKSIFYIDLHSSKPNEPRQRHFSVKVLAFVKLFEMFYTTATKY